MALLTSMSTLAAGASRTFTLPPGSALTLTTLPNCRVTVTETPETVSASGVGGNASRVHDLQLAGVVTYGPYAMGGSVVVAVASNSGSTVTWVKSDAIFPSASILGQGLDIAGSRTVTGTTTETSAYQLTIPANSMGAEGSLRISFLQGHTDSGNNKTIRVKFGNSSPLVLTGITSAVDSNANTIVIQNMGATNIQEAHASLFAISTGTALVTSAVDTTVDQLLEVTLQLASSGESVSLRRILVELIRP